jgi:hypothetical protein
MRGVAGCPPKSSILPATSGEASKLLGGPLGRSKTLPKGYDPLSHNLRPLAPEVSLSPPGKASIGLAVGNSSPGPVPREGAWQSQKWRSLCRNHSLTFLLIVFGKKRNHCVVVFSHKPCLDVVCTISKPPINPAAKAPARARLDKLPTSKVTRNWRGGAGHPASLRHPQARATPRCERPRSEAPHDPLRQAGCPSQASGQTGDIRQPAMWDVGRKSRPVLHPARGEVRRAGQSHHHIARSASGRYWLG